jgi:hypothetical protein
MKQADLYAEDPAKIVEELFYKINGKRRRSFDFLRRNVRDIQMHELPISKEKTEFKIEINYVNNGNKDDLKSA